MDQFRKSENISANKSELSTDRVLGLIAELEKCIDDSQFIPATQYYRSIVLLALISKSLTLSRAICSLVEAGFPGESFGLSRTLVELYFTVRYITNKDSESRAQTFVKFFAKTHERFVELIDNHYPDKKCAKPRFHEQAIEDAKEFDTYHSWSGFTGQTKLMALEPDEHEKNEAGDPITQKFDYEVLYWWQSHYVHGTIRCLSEHEVEPGRFFASELTHGRRLVVGQTLCSTFWCFWTRFSFAVSAAWGWSSRTF